MREALEEQLRVAKARNDFLELHMLRYMVEVTKANRGICKLKKKLYNVKRKLSIATPSYEAECRRRAGVLEVVKQDAGLIGGKDGM